MMGKMTPRLTTACGALAIALLCACNGEEHRNATATALTGGNPVRGRAAIRQFGCGSCHAIPGIDGADGMVGPPLTGIAQRAYIAGVLQNSPQNMIRWLEDPPRVDSLTAMPNVGLTGDAARDITAYLYTLR